MAKTRRTFTPEFRTEAVKLVIEQGLSFAEAAHDLGIGETTLRSWKQALVVHGERAFPSQGNPPAHDAPMESFFASLKEEEVALSEYEDFADARRQLGRGSWMTCTTRSESTRRWAT